MGHGYFLTLVIVFAVVSNLAQYWMKDPAFGGMSGVVYGLFGYVWIHDKYEFGTRYQLPPNVIAISLTWYVVCLLGLIGSVANWAHSGGLFAGMLWGFVVSGHWRRVLRRIKGQ
jgi:GlpG protein